MEAPFPLRVKLVASLLLTYGVLQLLATSAWFVFSSRFEEFPPALRYLIVPAELTLGAVAGAAGFGLLRRTSWARPVATLVALAALLVVPFGTLFGVFALWALSTAKDG